MSVKRVIRERTITIRCSPQEAQLILAALSGQPVQLPAPVKTVLALPAAQQRPQPRIVQHTHTKVY